MKKFTKIGSFSNVVRLVSKWDASPEPISYRGTVKLHGTNAGVLCTPDALIPQSRSRVLTLDDDNIGFAKFLAGTRQQEVIRAIERDIRRLAQIPFHEDITLFGEWCGPKIQKGCAINLLPERHFVLFAVLREDVYQIPELLSHCGWFSKKPSDRDIPIHTVYDAARAVLEVDFSSLASREAAAGLAEQVTAEVEASCPYAGLFGLSGVGEGMVWVPMGIYHANSDLYFKTKGYKHRGDGRVRKVKVRLTPEVVKTIEAFVSLTATEARLEQGIDALREAGKDITMRSMGDYLKWFGNDIKIECADELEASGLEWKHVAKQVTNVAVEFFKAKCEVC